MVKRSQDSSHQRLVADDLEFDANFDGRVIFLNDPIKNDSKNYLHNG